DLKGPEVAASAGSLGTFRGRISYGKQFSNGLEGLVSFSGYGSRGYPRLYFPEFDDPATNNGISENLDGDRFYSSLLSASYGGLSVRAAYVWRNKDLPTAAFETVFNDPRNHTVDSRAFVELQYQRQFASRWDL